MPNTWLKSIYLKEGDFIAVSSLEPSTYNLERYVLWAEIESIEYIGQEQVYDISVEGTQNFFGNGILAHNAYLSGNVGISQTSPTFKLDITGDMRTTTGAYFATSSGNVGVGATAPASKLEVAAGDISIDNTRKLNLEGSAGDTFMYRTADNRVVLAVDGIEVADWVKK